MAVECSDWTCVPLPFSIFRLKRFAQLTGRSLAGFKRDFQKVFTMALGHWLREKRLIEARHLTEKKEQEAIYDASRRR
jgi:AraC-like DNA-binding protein